MFLSMFDCISRSISPLSEFGATCPSRERRDDGIAEIFTHFLATSILDPLAKHLRHMEMSPAIANHLVFGFCFAYPVCQCLS